jgi:hypothetical protein
MSYSDIHITRMILRCDGCGGELLDHLGEPEWFVDTEEAEVLAEYAGWEFHGPCAYCDTCTEAKTPAVTPGLGD